MNHLGKPYTEIEKAATLSFIFLSSGEVAAILLLHPSAVML